MPDEAKRKHWQYQVDTIMTEGLDSLNSNEEEFINDMHVKLNGSFWHLTDRQADWLEKIYDRITK